jgi:hypothetical protein
MYGIDPRLAYPHVLRMCRQGYVRFIHHGRDAAVMPILRDKVMSLDRLDLA